MQGIIAPIIYFLAANWLPVLVAATAAWLAENRYQKGLHKYPGPFLASLTDWWRVWDVYNRRSEVTHQKLHKQHGDVVRLGPNVLSFSDPKAVKAIYGLNKNMVKSDFYIVQQSVSNGRRLPSLFSTVDESFHAKFRRCVNAAFAMSSLVQYEPFVDNTTKLFLRQTQRLYADKPAGEDEGCDFGRWMQFYAFDVIGEITYSKRHGFIEKNEDIDGIVAYLSDMFLYVAPVGQMPFLDLVFRKNPIYLKLSQWGFFDLTFPAAKFARDRMAERLPAGGSMNGGFGAGADEKPAADPHPSIKTPDLLSKFLAAQKARPDFMNDTLVQTMAVSMTIAGSETTAISLSALFYNLLRNPSTMAKLRREIDDASRRGEFEDGETGLVTWHESQRLPYLDACIKEAFRVHPAAGLPLERIVPKGGMEIAGHFVPGGTIVGVSAWLIHNNKDIFGDDVDVYRPERWLVDEELVKAAGPAGDEVRAREEQRIKEMSGMMMQFGMGSRTCIGKNISLLEIYKVVPSLLRRFEIEFKYPEQEWELVNAWFIRQNNFWVRFKTRELVQPDKKSGAIAADSAVEAAG
ncbi:hypothetical protein MCOR25_009867 [Pyricularia grisea]|nr:hypothetical protein MCOR25_009867 [Pyricularia grisea]